MTGVLEEIPTEGASGGILDWLRDGEPLDEGHVVALAGIGSPSAIEPLYRLWKSGRSDERLLAEYLLVLCELNGVEKPELPTWRRIVEAEEARVERIAGAMARSMGGGGSPPERSSPARLDRRSGRTPKQRSTRKPQGIGKRERKKRAAQRQGQKKRR